MPNKTLVKRGVEYLRRLGLLLADMATMCLRGGEETRVERRRVDIGKGRRIAMSPP